jgi:hypothetical protein
MTNDQLEQCASVTSTLLGDLDPDVVARRDALYDSCMAKSGKAALDPFGVDPVFRKGSGIVDSSISRSPRTRKMFYDDQTTKLQTGAEILSPSKLPFGFHPNANGTVPVWFDVAMSEQRARAMMTYLRDGFFLSGSKTGSPGKLKMQMLTYNGKTATFGYTTVTAEFQDDGRIAVQPRFSIFNVDMYYPTPENETRLAFEVVFMILVIIDIAFEVRDCCKSFRAARQEMARKANSRRNLGKCTPCLNSTRAGFAYWTRNMWNILDTITLSLIVVQMATWGRFATTMVPAFSPVSLRHVYKSLHSNARYLELYHPPINGTGSTAQAASPSPSASNATSAVSSADPTYGHGLGWSAELQSVVDDFQRAEDIVNTREYLNMIIVFVILCQVMRLLKVLDFQPKLALVTRTVLNAGWELFHFMLLFGLQTCAFSGCAYVAFGTIHEDFSSFAAAIGTCFGLFMGETGVHYDMAESEMSTQWYFFYLSYMLLQFFILLNILLAILVDAYIAVRSGATLSSNIISELLDIAWYATQYALSPRTFVSDRTLAKRIGDALEERRRRERRARATMTTSDGADAASRSAALKSRSQNAWSNTKVAPEGPGGPAGGSKRRTQGGGFADVHHKDILLAKSFDGEAKVFAADRPYLQRALTELQTSNAAAAAASGAATQGGARRVRFGLRRRRSGDLASMDMDKLVNLLFDRLGVDRDVADDMLLDAGHVLDEAGETNVHLQEVNDLMGLDWSKSPENVRQQRATKMAASAPQTPRQTVVEMPPAAFEEVKDGDRMA